MFALVGVVLMLAISTFDYHQLHKLNLPVFAVSILLLLMVLVFKGTKLAPNKGGAVRWLNLGFVEFQRPRLQVRAHLDVCAPHRAVRRKDENLPLRLFAVFGILGLICVLVIAEKHVSATIIICLIAFIMMFVGGTSSAISPSSAARRQPPSARSCLFPSNFASRPWTVSTAG